jgi:O-antigen/teichoic acid export membrane protein
LSARTTPRIGVHKVLVNAGAISLARLIAVACRVAYVVVAARVLGAEAYGALSVAFALALAFLPLTTLGLGPHLIAELSGDKSASPQLLSRTLSLTAVGTLLASGIAAVIGLATEEDAHLRLLIVVCALALLGRGLARWTDNVFVAYERPTYTLRQEATFRALEVSCAILVLLAGGDALTVAIVAATCWLVQARSGLRLVQTRVIDHPLRRDFTGAKGLVIAAIPLLVAQLCAQALLHYPVIFARHLFDDAQTIGNIALAMQALVVAGIAPGAVALMAMPALARSHARSDGRDGEFIELMLRAAFVATAALVILTMAIGPTLLPLIAGPQYTQAGDLLWLSMLITGPLALFLGTGSWLLAGRRYIYLAASGAAALFALILSTQLLVPFLGPASVFLATAVGFTIGTLARLIPILRTHPGVFDKHTLSACLTATATASGYVIWTWVGFPSLPGAVLAVSLLTIATLRFGLKSRERWMLMTRISATPACCDKPAKRPNAFRRRLG